MVRSAGLGDISPLPDAPSERGASACAFEAASSSVVSGVRCRTQPPRLVSISSLSSLVSLRPSPVVSGCLPHAVLSECLLWVLPRPSPSGASASRALRESCGTSARKVNLCLRRGHCVARLAHIFLGILAGGRCGVAWAWRVLASASCIPSSSASALGVGVGRALSLPAHRSPRSLCAKVWRRTRPAMRAWSLLKRAKEGDLLAFLAEDGREIEIMELLMTAAPMRREGEAPSPPRMHVHRPFASLACRPWSLHGLR